MVKTRCPSSNFWRVSARLLWRNSMTSNTCPGNLSMKTILGADTSCRYLRCRCGYYCRYLYKCHFQVGFWEIFDQQAGSTGDKIWFFGKARGHGGRHWKTAALSLNRISISLSCDTRLLWKPGKYGTEDCFNLQYFHYHINFNWSFRGCITRQNVCYFFSA